MTAFGPGEGRVTAQGLVVITFQRPVINKVPYTTTTVAEEDRYGTRVTSGRSLSRVDRRPTSEAGIRAIEREAQRLRPLVATPQALDAAVKYSLQWRVYQSARTAAERERDLTAALADLEEAARQLHAFEDVEADRQPT